MASALTAALVVAALVLACVRHQWLILAYVVSLGWVPAGLGRDVFFSMDIDDILLLAVAVFSIPSLAKPGRFRPDRLGKFALVYWALSVVSNTVTIALHTDMFAVIRHQMMKDAAILALLLGIEADLADKTYVRKFVLAMCIAAAGALTTTLIDYLIPQLDISRLWEKKTSSALGLTRYAGTQYETYLAGAYFLGGLGVCLALIAHRSNPLLRAFALIAIPLLLVGVLAGQSRSTYAGVAVLGLCATGKPRRALLMIPVLLVAWKTIASNTELTYRLFGRVATTTTGLGGRAENWRNYITQAPPRVFLIGEGFVRHSLRTLPGHSAYIEVLADTGIPGLILFCSLWYHVLTAPKRIRRAAETPMQLALGIGAVWISIAFLVSSAAIGLIVQTTYRMQFMFWIAIALAPAWERWRQVRSAAVHAERVATAAMNGRPGVRHAWS